MKSLYFFFPGLSFLQHIQGLTENTLKDAFIYQNVVFKR